MGVEINHHHFFHAPFTVEDGCRQRRIGIDAEAATPRGRRVVKPAAQIDRHAVLQGQATRQDGSARRQPHRLQDPPIDQETGQPADDRHLQDASKRLSRLRSEFKILWCVHLQQVAPGQLMSAEESRVGRRSPRAIKAS